MSHFSWGGDGFFWNSSGEFAGSHWPEGTLLCNMETKRGLDPALNLSLSAEQPSSVNSDSQSSGMAEGK